MTAKPHWITLGQGVLGQDAEAVFKVRSKLNMKLIKDGAKMRLVDVDTLDIISDGEIDLSA